MTLEEAKEKAAMIAERESRSHVCSFINELESSKLITNKDADSLADILSSARENASPVLRCIIDKLARQS